MDARKILGLLVLSSLLLGAVFALGSVSIQLKTTNEGVVSTDQAAGRPAEIIFDVVNTDMTHKMEGFIWCRSPDDAQVSSSLGAGSGSGAQYVSPKFTVNEGPSQKSISLTMTSLSVGQKLTGCIIKYIFVGQKVEGTGDNAVTKTIYTRPMGTGGDIATPSDEDYAELRLDNALVFKEAAAPAGKGIGRIPTTYLIVIGFVVLALGVAYVMGKTARP